MFQIASYLKEKLDIAQIDLPNGLGKLFFYNFSILVLCNKYSCVILFCTFNIKICRTSLKALLNYFAILVLKRYLVEQYCMSAPRTLRKT